MTDNSGGNGGWQVAGEPYDAQYYTPRRWPKVLLALALLFVLVAGTGGFLLYRSALRAQEQATIAVNGISALTDDILSGNQAMLNQRVSDVAAASLAMYQETDSLLWSVGGRLPLLGTDVANVRTLADVLNNLSQNALVPMGGDASRVLMDHLMEDGGFNVPALQQLTGLMSEIAPTLVAANDELAQIVPGHVGWVNEGVERAKARLTPLVGVGVEADRIARHLPQMLGVNGQSRRYLVLVPSNAEIRSAGGVIASWGVVTVRDGKIDVSAFASPGKAVGGLFTGEPVQLLHEAGTEAGLASLGISPQFPKVAQHACEIYAAAQSAAGLEVTPIDGVIAADPFLLQQLLALTGASANLYGVYVDGGNAASVLLSRIYWDVSEEYQDAICAATAQQALESLANNLGKVDLLDLLELVGKNGEGRHLMAWFADAEEQHIIAKSAVTGVLAADAHEPVVGVYLNDCTHDKMDWYLSCDTSWSDAVPNDDGTSTYHVTTLLANHITSEQARSAPASVVGDGPGAWTNDLGDVATHVFLFAPAGGGIANVVVDNPGRLRQEIRFGTTNGLSYASLVPCLPRESALTIAYDVTVSAQAAEALALDTTPTPQDAAGW